MVIRNKIIILKILLFIYVILFIEGLQYFNLLSKNNESINKLIISFKRHKTFIKKTVNEKNKNNFYIPLKINKQKIKINSDVNKIKHYAYFNSLLQKKSLFLFSKKNSNERKSYLSKKKYSYKKKFILYENGRNNNITEEKKINLINNIQKNYLSIDLTDENNETSDILLKIHIKGKLREYYYDFCVKKYKENKLKENKYEYSYLNDVPINNLINYIDKNDYFRIFLKYVNEDIIKVYKSIKNLHLIGSPRLLNRIDHIHISKFDDITLNFSIDKYPTIKFNKSYINLDLIVKIPPYEKGSAFKEFLKILKSENEITIDSDENYKVEWNNDVQINVLRGWVYNFNNIYYDEFCKVESNNNKKIGIINNEKKVMDEESVDKEKDILKNNKINDLIDIDKDEESFINNSDNYKENSKDENDENLFNDTANDNSDYEFLKNVEYNSYFKQGYQLPNNIISMNNSTVSIKENYNPLGLNESLIGMGRNEKKNITVYIPIYLFKDYFQNNQLHYDKNIDEVINLKEINKESINKFREIIYKEIKKMKHNSVFQKIEDVLKKNENKFFDNNTLEKSLKKHDENNEEKKEHEEENNANSKTEEEYYYESNEEDIDSILNDDDVICDEDKNEKKKKNKQNEKNEIDENKEKNEEVNFNKRFDKYLEELLKDDINSLDNNLYNIKNDKTKEIFQNICDFSENDKEEMVDEDLHDYILGKSDLIKCVLEVEVLNIKIRKEQNQNINDYILKKYNKTYDELYDDIEERAIKDIQNKCIQQKRMEAYKKLMEITSLNVPITLFRAQGKRMYNNYLKNMKMKKDENEKTENILNFEDYIKKSQKDIYDQIKFSFIVKSIFQNSNLKLNYEEIIKDVIKALIKTPTNNVKNLIKRIYTIHQAQCVLDFVSLNANTSYDTDHSSINFSVNLKKGSHYTNEFLNEDSHKLNKSEILDDINLLEKDKNNNKLCNEKSEEKILHFNDDGHYVIEKKKENEESIELEYYTFRKGANYTKYFHDKNKKSN
ncbi:conserved Plasmodium protein, unknown function [Plasmodium gallinaceum]|uniref:Trigger factor C-terminal domain-containing protein n=1 Tax=Plasmodium gallinaceum TaxID=5849 RepID=A0A1J1GTD0_PLAGA|nr:conserved Plasmodium protein, unknown function [Plasmodium gallinaceum]CRG95772.1 conserved Plasmodium protein, unknown function [Plasmodium gallinaceum]